MSPTAFLMLIMVSSLLVFLIVLITRILPFVLISRLTLVNAGGFMSSLLVFFFREEVLEAIASGTGGGRNYKGYNAFNEALFAWQYSEANGHRPPNTDLLPYPDYNNTGPDVLPRQARDSTRSRQSTPAAQSSASFAASSSSAAPGANRSFPSASSHRAGPSGSSRPRTAHRPPPPPPADPGWWVILRGRAPGVYNNL